MTDQDTPPARKSYYFADSAPLAKARVAEISKRYNYLLDILHLFPMFIRARASKDPKFREQIQQVEQYSGKPILEEKSSLKTSGHVDARHRKSEKEEDAELLNAKNDSDDIVEFTESPSYIHGTLREYQIQGLNWLVQLHENNLSGILADEMGLGKTLQTISFLGYLRFFRGMSGPHLVIVPKSTLENWQREFAKWVPEFETLILTGDKDQRAEIIANDIMACKFDVVILSYELVIKEKATLRKFAWGYIVIDEAHRIKNEQSMLSQVIRLFTLQNRLLITGTPLQNNLHELWALLNFLLPDVFGDSESFDDYFGAPGQEHKTEEQQQEVIKQLHTILRPFLLRRIKSQVEKSLLPKKEVNLYVPLAPQQKKLYRSLLEKDMDAINGLNGKKESKTRLLNIVMQLRKCCNHPYLFDGVEPGPPFTTDEHLVDALQKLKTLDRLLKKAKAEGLRVLIFSQMSRMLDIMEDYCYFRQYEYCRIDGSTDHEDRVRQIDEYNAEGSKKFIFLLTTRAGGLGINLTTADVVVLYDLDWNPQADLQAMDRAHRIGQKKQVKVYRMVTENLIEEKVLERAMKKLRLDQVVIQQARTAPAASNNVGKDELLDMIRHGAQDVLDLAKSTDGDDVDLEKMLASSEAKTKELNNKYSQLGFDELQDLGTDHSSAYQWNGTDFKKNGTKKIGSGSGFQFLSYGKRERKENYYNVDGYYRETLHPESKRSTEPKAPRAPKQIQLYDHQFASQELCVILAKEANWWKKQAGYKVPLNHKPQVHGGPGNIKQYLNSEDHKLDNMLQQVEINNAVPLTEEEEKRKEELLGKTYASWTRREFQQFVQLSGKHGRELIGRIAKEMRHSKVVNNYKTEEEVREYLKVFWDRFTEIEGFERYIHQVEQGEEKIAKMIKQKRSLHKKVSQYTNPLRDLKLRFPPSLQAFTPEEDAFLLVHLYRFGLDTYNVYEMIHKAALASDLFKFDYFLKTRTSTELNRRCNALMANVVKECEFEEAEMRLAIQRKKKKGKGKKLK